MSTDVFPNAGSHPTESSILLVEDEATDVALIRRALRRGGLVNPIEHVSDGEAAVDYLLSRCPPAADDADRLPVLVLLDLKLPRLDGFGVLERLKSTESLKRLPVVVLTSSAESEDVERAYDCGANSYLVKPVEFAAFVEVARRINRYWLLLNTPPRPGGGR